MAIPEIKLPSTGTSTPIKLSEDDLEKDLSTTKKTEKELQKLLGEVKKQFDDVDKIIQEHATKWMEHLEDFIKELVQQLEENGISLTAEEKAELRSGMKTISEIRNKIKKLRKLNIDIAESAAYYIVVSYDTTVTALSRLLQKIDNASIKGVIKKLKILEKEKDDIQAIIAAQSSQYSKIITAVQKIKEEANKHPLPAADKIAALDAYLQFIEKVATKQAAAPEIKAVLE